jgi:hypothetical protein
MNDIIITGFIMCGFTGIAAIIARACIVTSLNSEEAYVERTRIDAEAQLVRAKAQVAILEATNETLVRAIQHSQPGLVINGGKHE